MPILPFTARPPTYLFKGHNDRDWYSVSRFSGYGAQDDSMEHSTC